MAKKIEGWAIEQYNGGGRYLFEHVKHSSEYSKATLVVTNERVFTESEVRAMVNTMIAAVRMCHEELQQLTEEGHWSPGIAAALEKCKKVLDLA